MKTKVNFIIFVILSLILVGCASQQENITPTPNLPPTNSPTPSPTSTPRIPPTPQSTPIGGGSGTIVVDDYENIYILNLSTGEKTILVSRQFLEDLMPEDRSVDAYGVEFGINLNVSPDLTKVFASVCSILDERFRCVQENFVYDIKTKLITKLQNPPAEYNVLWQWNSDSTKLVGVGLRYGDFGTELTAFYKINSDGTGLNSLYPVTNYTYSFAFHPNGQIIYPLTFLSNFKAVYIDGSKEEDVTIEGLKLDDKIECLDFSENGEKITFGVTRETQKGYYWIYTANSDFTEPSLLTEFDSDAHYDCKLKWSPDNTFILVSYDNKRVSNGSESDPLSLMFDALTGASIKIPIEEISQGGGFTYSSQEICDWTPDGKLVYLKEWEVKVLDLSTSRVLSLPKIISGCPLQWLVEDLSFEIPENSLATNACFPGISIEDEEDESISPYVDILKVSSSLDGETLSVTFTLKLITEDLSVYQDPDYPNSITGWTVGIDVDNNVLTGDSQGVELELVINNNNEILESDLWKYNSSDDSYVSIGNVSHSLDASTNTITVTGRVPKITENSRLIFSSTGRFNGKYEKNEVCE